ncbi:hypothetical protein [Nocardia iowensis]|uniref:Lipopolysaccharide assembly protein A domain-containing protein n=1 Tax=Nocardia iowensis TaxID=204891 RepID=A0ABX8RTE7_NOCIO|nr:hypothetical protein [Nocardia iowensis]QXN92919.1 hypothetical protein KV110_07345 [Nocardia iowensis]
MIIIIGLVVLIAAVIIGVAGVVANNGEANFLPSDFAVFDYHFHGSSGLLFGYGIALGAIGTLGLALLLTGVWRVSRRNMAARRELRQSRREMAAVRRDLADGTPPARQEPAPQPHREPVWSRFVRRPATAPAGDTSRADSTLRVQAPTSK